MKSKIFGILTIGIIATRIIVLLFFKMPDPGLWILVPANLGYAMLAVVTIFASEDFLQKKFGREQYDRDWAIEIFQKWCRTLSCYSSYCLAKEGWVQTFEYGGEVLEFPAPDGKKYLFVLPGGMSSELVLKGEYMETERGMSYSVSQWTSDCVVSFKLLSKEGVAIAEFVPILGASMRFIKPRQEVVLKVA